MVNVNGDHGGFFDTKERTTSWVVRILLLLISAVGAIALWLAQSTLADIQYRINNQDTAVWSAVGKLTESQAKLVESQAETEKSSAVLSATLTAHIKEDDGLSAELRKIVTDHEGRIRSLEHIYSPH
jgi:hypothetical protein